MTSEHDSFNFNREVDQLEISQIRQFDDKVSAFEPLIRLTLGQPDFKTPEHIKEAAKKGIDNDFSFYTKTAGDQRLLEAASHFFKTKYNVDYSPDNEIIATVGATEALAASLISILNPGDKVLIPSPFFSLYETLVKLCKAEPVFIDTSSSDFMITPALIEEAINRHGERVKAVIFNYPNNPSGSSWTRKEVKDIADLLKEYPHIIAVSDEIYSEIAYEENHVSLGEYLRDQTIVINGLSKSHAMTGWRLGLIFAPDTFIHHIIKTHQALVTSTSSVTQFAGIEALTNGMDDTAPMKKEYRMRRDYVIQKLHELDFHIVQPKGAFYIFAKIPETIQMNSYDFSYALAERSKVAVIPGNAFGESGEGYIRISYAASFENIKEAMKRMKQFIEESNQ